MPSLDEVTAAIRNRDTQKILDLFFETGNIPVLRDAFKTENELWDYKKDIPPHGDDVGWAKIAVDVAAFHNNRGGLLIFGISDDYRFVGAKNRYDSKLFNDKIRKYVGDTLWVQFQRFFIQHDQSYVGVGIIPPRGPWVTRFRADGPRVGNRQLFLASDVAYRDGDQSRIFLGVEGDRFARTLHTPAASKLYYVDRPFYRILQPDYGAFIYRKHLCDTVTEALTSDRTFVTSITGIGGIGKTALATWAVIEAYEHGKFEYIVSLTAKDRELTAGGILPLQAGLTSFDGLLNTVIDVLQFSELRDLPTEEKEKELLGLLKGTKGLLFVDNLETVDDQRIVKFLENLPAGPRVITTSRRARVRVAAKPVEVDPFTEPEAVDFLRSLAGRPGFDYLANLPANDATQVVNSCDRIPLVIKWFVAQVASAPEAIREARRWANQGIHGDELLEFCFRRVYEQLAPLHQSTLQVLSIFHRPVAFEALIVATGGRADQVSAVLDDLIDDSLVERTYDVDLNDYSYHLLPITRSFVYSEVSKKAGLEAAFRQRLAEWYEAKDIKDPVQRQVLREIRQGKSGEDALVDLAMQARKSGDTLGSEQLFLQALARNPRNWRACREYAELCRHELQNTADALKYYEQAADNAPKKGRDRFLIFREWGMLLRNSGLPDATQLAIDKFEIALKEEPSDPRCRHALGDMYRRRGAYRKMVEVLEPLVRHPSDDTRKRTYPLLLEAYTQLGDILKVAQLKDQMLNDKGIIGDI